MFALLGLVFPFIKAFLGDGIIEKFLNHKKELAASANERERMNIEADVKVLGYELERRKAIRDIQLKTYEHPLLWWPKWILEMSIMTYWASRFWAKILGLDDFSVVIKELSSTEATVSMMVLSFYYLGDKLERMISRK